MPKPIKCDCGATVERDYKYAAEIVDYPKSGYYLWLCTECGQKWREEVKPVKNIEQ